MITHTSISDFLNMPMNRFYSILTALVRVLEKRKQ